jgi:hypothetical protein
MNKAEVESIVPPLRQQLRREAQCSFASSQAESVADHAAEADQVTKARSQAMRQSRKQPGERSIALRVGRLRLFAPEDNLADGAAEDASMGFFDMNHVPPWDASILMFDKYLVLWFPPQLVWLVQGGLDVNPEQCFLWADGPSVSKELIATALGELSAKAA